MISDHKEFKFLNRRYKHKFTFITQIIYVLYKKKRVSRLTPFQQFTHLCYMLEYLTTGSVDMQSMDQRGLFMPIAKGDV